MSSTAIVMMLIAMIILWGGLALAIWNITRSGRGTVPEVDHRDL